MMEYQDSANSLVSDLLDACARNDAVKGGAVTATVFYSRDINLLMMVLGTMSARVVNAENMARNAHGPLVTPEKYEIDSPMEPWATGMLDQLRTAADNGDFHTFGRMAVDAHIKALISDRKNYGEHSVDLAHIVRAMMMIDQQTLSVIAAEALLRLLNMYEGT